MKQGNRKQQNSPLAVIPCVAGRQPVAVSCMSSSLTTSNIVASPCKYIGSFAYLLQHSDHADTANSTCC